MTKPDKNGQREKALTPEQLTAVDLLATGMSDADVAEQVQRARSSICNWKLYNPAFQAMLNQRRADLWQGAGDKLRAIIPRALTVLEQALESPDNQFKAACTLVKMANIPLGAIDRRSEEEIVISAAKDIERRNMDEMLSRLRTDAVRSQLLARANGEED